MATLPRHASVRVAELAIELGTDEALQKRILEHWRSATLSIFVELETVAALDNIGA